ncbi:MAG TPA: hypothetical protein VFA58_02240 [Chthoniobacterales bacterium]|nr:hypothetical protein [Chthoniobacterales bacterium]
MLLLVPIVVCGVFGAGVGYAFRYQAKLRRLAILAMATAIFLVVEITSGTLSSKNGIGENLAQQLSLLMPFLLLYLLPAAFGSFFVARRFRIWAE